MLGVKVVVGVSLDTKVGVKVLVGVEVLEGVFVGVWVSLAVWVGVDDGVRVFVAVLVILEVGVLGIPYLRKLNEIMIVPKKIARMAMTPIMVLDFIISSRKFRGLPGSRCRARYQFS
jgi:hypothetical protein